MAGGSVKKGATVMTTKRTYGIERYLGDIMYDPKTKVVFARIGLGKLFQTTITLTKNGDGGYDITKPIKNREGQEVVLKLGKTFPAKRKDGSILEGMTKGSFGLVTTYDKELGKEISTNEDAIFFTTHKLKETKQVGSIMKIGFITGQFGIEIQEEVKGDAYEHEAPATEIPDDEIPF